MNKIKRAQIIISPHFYKIVRRLRVLFLIFFLKTKNKNIRSQVDRVVAKFDSNGDGKLDFDEFKKMLKK